MVRHGALHHGHSGLCHYVHFDYGQSYVDGMRFVQFYFGLPLAMIVISAFVVPGIPPRARLHGLRIPGEPLRFQDPGAGEHNLSCQRGLSAGLTIYAPALVLSVILGWPEHYTTIMMGATVVTLHVLGGIKAVTGATCSRCSSSSWAW
jgi:hypothetical protein